MGIEVMEVPSGLDGLRRDEMKTPGDVAAMIRLRALGWGSKRIAAELGCSRNTVRRWLGEGVSGREPVTWRRRLKRAGLVPEPVARGLGPHWNPRIDPALQLGAGARAAYLLAAEKRRLPLTPRRVPLLGPAVGERA